MSSPVLIPLDYFLWGYLNSLVYEALLEKDKELGAACDAIRKHEEGGDYYFILLLIIIIKLLLISR